MPVLVLGLATGVAIGSGGAISVVALVLVAGVLVGAIAFAAPRRAPVPSVQPGGPVPRPRDERVDTFARGLGFCALLTWTVVAADAEGFTNVGSPKFRYGLLVLPLFGLLAVAATTHGRRFQRMTRSDRWLAALVTLGLVGSFYGRLVRGTPNPGTVIFLPMCVGFTHLLLRSHLTEAQAKRFLRALVRLAVLFLALRVVSRTSIWPFGVPESVGHEEIFFAAMGITAARLERRFGMVALITVLCGVMFLQYPAATWLVVIGAIGATVIATSARNVRVGLLIIVVFAVGVLGIAAYDVQSSGSSVSKGYFSSVGKVDNTDTRSELWRAAELTIRKSPFVGSLFTGNFTVANVNQVVSELPAYQQIEPHNDYLEITVLGGLFGLFLFGAFIFSTNGIMIRRIERLTAEGPSARTNLSRALLVGLNAALASAVFNPEVSQMGIGATVFFVYAVMMAVGPTRTETDRTFAPGAERLSVAAGSS